MKQICKCGHGKNFHINKKCMKRTCKCKKFEAEDEVPKEVVDKFIKKGLEKIKTQKGCGKPFKMVNDYSPVDCGEDGELCPNCKPQNHNEYVREWNKKNPDKVKKIVKKYRSKNKEKQPAWDKARRGIGAIKIEGLCQICKIEKAELRHHEDYSKPREVLLICSKCHKNIHSNSQHGRKPKGDSNSSPADTLSDKITKSGILWPKDVKEFIKRLRSRVIQGFGKRTQRDLLIEIDNLAGEELSK